MAVRNCVVRAPELRKPFLALHIENIANEALKNHKLDEAKACLRDLGCEVDLKCIWTGSGKKLEHGTTDRLKDMDIN
jgi:muramoyltetrapeptide carboxypeptidase LdcA involved in peptidoglycan recycling